MPRLQTASQSQSGLAGLQASPLRTGTYWGVRLWLLLHCTSASIPNNTPNQIVIVPHYVVLSQYAYVETRAGTYASDSPAYTSLVTTLLALAKTH